MTPLTTLALGMSEGKEGVIPKVDVSNRGYLQYIML